jgi:uncharacterized protein (PEP-CTERM system associated)
MDYKAARARARVEFRLHDARYSTDSSLDDTRRFLDANGTVEAVEKWLYLDAHADITQQNRSAFGTSSTPDRPTVSGNQVETSVVKLSPHIAGELGSVATYRLRFNAADVRTDDATLADTKLQEWVGRIAPVRVAGRLSWAVDGQLLKARNDVIGSVDDRRIRGAAIFAVSPQFRISLYEGYESNTFESPERSSDDTPGAGISWTPSEHTQLAAVYEKRFFGDGHSLAFNHRTGRTSFRLTSVRDAAVLPGVGLGGGSAVTALLADLVAASVIDPEERAAAARQRLEDFGLASYSSLGSSVLSSQPIVYRLTEAQVAFTNPRDIVTLTYGYRDQRTLGTVILVPENDYRQRGAEANWGHRLTPVTTLNLFASYVRTEGVTAGAAESKQGRYGASLTSRLGPRSTAVVGVRRGKLDTTAVAGDYTENAVFAAFTVRF